MLKAPSAFPAWWRACAPAQAWAWRCSGGRTLLEAEPLHHRPDWASGAAVGVGIQLVVALAAEPDFLFDLPS